MATEDPMAVSDTARFIAAIGSAFADISISLQNVLTFSTSLVIPFILYVLGGSWHLALAVGMSLVICFVAWKASRYYQPRWHIVCMGSFLASMLIGLSILYSEHASPLNEPRKLPHESIRQHTTGDQSPAVVSGRDVEIHLGAEKREQRKQ